MTSPVDELHRIGAKVTRQLADDIVEEIRTNPHTPYDAVHHRAGTPHLRDSFRVVETARGVDLISEVDYWFYVEYGHRTRPSRQAGHVQRWVPAQPYLRPAIQVAMARQRQREGAA
jgi:hypothetical protein